MPGNDRALCRSELQGLIAKNESHTLLPIQPSRFKCQEMIAHSTDLNCKRQLPRNNRTRDLIKRPKLENLWKRSRGAYPDLRLTALLEDHQGDSGYPNLLWLLTPVRNARTGAEERYNEAHGRTRRIIKRTFGLPKARFRCLHLTGGSLCYSPEKVCQVVVACCMLHNPALRMHVPFRQEEETGDAPVQ
ncbi:hypothetical protein NDU88_002934 [Pleurodeles waltl]|uniref:DDE Tnp4 domain-containing protein n=1 Tax=Pleurodeles waltl TaxID=8319 RepID=A0AAV7KWS4_PLEWA|nr:hypothetical protein NDU88_002934 [Pleurodeles waltl]